MEEENESKFFSFLQGRHFRDAVISINKYIYSVHTYGCLHNMVNCKHCLHRQGFRTDHFTAISYFFYSFKGARNFTLHHTEVPWHNEGPRHWQNLFAMTRFQYINLGVFSICFTMFYYVGEFEHQHKRVHCPPQLCKMCYSSFFYPLPIATRAVKYMNLTLHAIPYNLFLVLSSNAKPIQTKKYFGHCSQNDNIKL